MSILGRIFGSKPPPASSSGPPRSIRALLQARTPPWNSVPLFVINAIFDALDETELFDCFVRASMEAKLLREYANIDAEFEALSLARARISMILSQAGNRELTQVSSDVKARRIDKARERGRLVADLFDTAIAFSREQMGGYVGMATLFALLGVQGKSTEYARRGLDELERIRDSDAGRAMSESAVFPQDMHDATERQLRAFLSDAG
jgi:hypothetical protein